MKPTEDLSLKKRFVSDMNLPICIFDEPYFTYFINLYENNFQSLTKWNNEIITDILNSDSYKEFNNMDMSMFAIKKYGFSTSNIYNETNNNRKFISVDLKKANFQALRLVNVIDDKNYFDFLSHYTDIQYIKDSKYTRQVIFGKLNAKRQITVEKYIISLIYETLLSFDWFKEIIDKVESFASDEIVFSVKNNVDDYTVNFVINDLSLYIQQELGYSTDVEYFVLTMHKFYTYKNDQLNVFKKQFLNIEKDDEILTVPMFYYAQVYKLLNNLPIEDNDLLFNMEGQIAKFLNPLKFE